MGNDDHMLELILSGMKHSRDEWDHLCAEHVKRFGVEPYISGCNWQDPQRSREGLRKALEEGKPYIEPDPPEGALY